MDFCLLGPLSVLSFTSLGAARSLIQLVVHLDMTAEEDTRSHRCCRLWASWDGSGITGKSVTGLGA